MKTEAEIKQMLKRSIQLDGLVSPSAIAALEWILGIGNEYDVFQEQS